MENCRCFWDLPAPPRPLALRLLPVFVPFAGCRGRCLYCHQPAQTGVAEVSSHALVEHVRRCLEGVQGAVGVGLYGGSLTALPWGLQQAVVSQVRRSVEAHGELVHLRLSTRPDALTPTLLRGLRRLGVDMVEVGVQSFASPVLSGSGRGYDGAVARAACQMVRDAGLALGIQLLPGLPGHDEEAWWADVECTEALAPEILRIYPCLVLEGTRLAQRYRQGRFRPWELAATTALLAEALPRLWSRGIRVARLGLAPQPQLRILAGPAHPALGNMVRALAVVRQVVRVAAGKRIGALVAPWWVQGDLWGYRRGNVPTFTRLGLAPWRVAFDDTEGIRLWESFPSIP